jgi:tRNA(fMet)-specific endonuclease VapC
MPRYLLDTNVISEPIRPRPDQAVMAHLKRHQGELATAAVVWHELLFGCQRLPRSARRTMIESYCYEVVLPTVIILPYGTEAAAWHATIRASLLQSGKTLTFVDGQIAAIAKVNDLILVTRNVKDYRPFSGIKIENWWSSAK